VRSRRRLTFGLTTLLAISMPLFLLAQRGGGLGGLFGGGRFYGGIYDNVRYDGRFAFVRIRYLQYSRWSADYPTMERNLTTMLKELTSIDPHLGASNVQVLDDPDLLKFPVAYLTEPGSWFPTEQEVQGLRNYLAKGGFLIVDDFFDPYDHFGREWTVFYNAMKRVLPDAKIETLDVSHPVFNSFFHIKSLRVPYPGTWGERGLMGEFYGIHEDNDSDRRLMVVINYNMDIGDYMEWSATDVYNPLPTNEAYKFGINYVVYGLTH
jgi:hypothetical protein